MRLHQRNEQYRQHIYQKHWGKSSTHLAILLTHAYTSTHIPKDRTTLIPYSVYQLIDKHKKQETNQMIITTGQRMKITKQQMIDLNGTNQCHQ